MIQQGTEEWFEARLGKITASNLIKIMAAKTTASYKSYLYELAVERFTKTRVDDSYRSPDMIRGIELEDDAATVYLIATDQSISKIGFISHPTIVGSGASPDRLAGKDGLVEIKCPRRHNHIATLTGNEKIKKAYQLQMQWQMACTNRSWCDFVSYCPDLSPSLQLYVERINRDDEKIAEIEVAVESFNQEIETVLNQLICITRET